MKSLKKALAVLLSVLMIAFSFPLSALAVENPNNIGYAPGEEPFSTDYDVELHAFVMDYDGYDSYGFWSSTEGQTLDPKHISREKLASPDGVFCIYFTISGLDKVSSWQLTLPYNTEILTPAEYGRRDALSTGPDVPVLEDLTMYKSGASNGGYFMNLNGTDSMYFCCAMGSDTDNFDDETEVDVDCVLPGQVVACVGFQLLTDDPTEEVDLTKEIRLRNDNVGCQVETEFGINEEKYIVGYGATLAIDYPKWYGGPYYKNDPSPQTQFTWPEWGYAPAAAPENVTYTYNFADGGSTEVTAPAGEAPTAPDNTAAKVKSNGDGTHTTTTYTWPAWEEGTLTYDEVATPVQADCDLQLTTPEVPATHTTPGTTAVYTCSVCGYTTGGDVIEPDADNHDWQLKETVPSTCSTQGYKEYTCECGETMREDLALDPSNHEGPMEDIPAVEATCVVEGFTAGEKCSACGATTVEPESLGINPDNHKNVVTDEAVAATCVSTGLTEGSHCADCDATIVAQTETPVDPENHVGPFVSADNAVAPTKGENGHEADTICEACGTTTEYGAVIPATGVQITVEQSELGTSTINSEATTGEAQKVPYGKNYTLVATPSDDADFVGWQVNGKLISTDTTYTTAAYADLTYTPVFAEKTNDFTVTFVDQFNMVLDTVTGSELADLEALPTPYDYLGYTFSGWSMTLEEVKALEANAVVTACYDKDEVTYTVNAPGCTITVGGETYYDTATVGFDEGVTVAATDETATAWTVNGANASYGSEYTFFVTSDVTVGYTTDEVTAEPTVAAVDTTLTDNGKVRFLATRNVPAGYTLLESGFVYGKDVVDPEASLVLENVNNTCYLYKNSNMAGDGQFALTFGITSQTGVAYARAYVIAADVNGNSAVYYADVQSYDYDA